MKNGIINMQSVWLHSPKNEIIMLTNGKPKGDEKMKLNYKQLTYIVGVLKEAERKAYQEKRNQEADLEEAKNDYYAWLESNPNASRAEQADVFEEITEEADERYQKASDAYLMAQDIYKAFAEGELEI